MKLWEKEIERYFYVSFYGMTYSSYTDEEYKQKFSLSFTILEKKEKNREYSKKYWDKMSKFFWPNLQIRIIKETNQEWKFF